MKPIKFTKADEKRAAKMGFKMHQAITPSGSRYYWRLLRIGDRFKSDADAAEWVVEALTNDWRLTVDVYSWDTCRKAVLLCCGGGR